MLDIARSTLEKHSLVAVAIVHRLGPVPIGEQSILVGVSAGHRQAAWRGAEDALELVKARVEIWKLEEFEDEGVWRANRDGAAGVRVDGGGGSGSTDTCMVGIDTRAVTDSDTAIDTTDTADPADPEEVEQLSFGPVIRPRPLGERGHGPVVNFRQ